MGETLFLVVVLVLMFIAAMASILPFVPGPVLVWAIGLLYAVLTKFGPISVPTVLLMTALMLIGSSTAWWTQTLGMKAQGSSPLSIIGALVGGLIGTFAIPIPVLGTLIGLVFGSLLLEFARVRKFRVALRAGNAAVRGYVLSALVETGISILILIVFGLSALF